MKQSEINEAINAQQSIVLDREARLTATDYIAANAEIERLKALEPDPDDEPIPEE